MCCRVWQCAAGVLQGVAVVAGYMCAIGLSCRCVRCSVLQGVAGVLQGVAGVLQCAAGVLKGIARVLQYNMCDRTQLRVWLLCVLQGVADVLQCILYMCDRTDSMSTK